MHDIIPAAAGPSFYSLAGLEDVAEELRDYVQVSRAKNTRRAYASDWRHFTAWCVDRSKDALPADPRTIALYLADLARTHKVATLERRVSAISQAHQVAGVDPSPTRAKLVQHVMAGIRRQHGTHQVGAAPVGVEDLRTILAALPDDLQGTRDRALLILGFLGAFRREEVVALRVEDLEFRPAGIVVHMARSKTDQEGQGYQKGIPRGRHPATCPVRAIREWLDNAEITSGPVFRGIDRHGRVSPRALTPQSVALVLKRAAAAAGYDTERISGHSLRAGLATAAADAGAEERNIKKQTGHTSDAMVRKYIRQGALFRDNAAAAVRL